MGESVLTPSEHNSLPFDDEFALWLAGFDERLAAGEHVKPLEDAAVPAGRCGRASKCKPTGVSSSAGSGPTPPAATQIQPRRAHRIKRPTRPLANAGGPVRDPP